MMVNLLNYSASQMADFFLSIGEKPFRAKQLLRWIHQYGEADFAAMSDISKHLRERLGGIAEIVAPTLRTEQCASDGTRKWLLDVGDTNGIETVFIPETDRGTLCVSSQIGCALNCSFCSTARQGFNRNLTVAEIIGQLWWANRALGRDPKGERIISNVVLMGMGEPLLNFDNVVNAVGIMLDDFGYGLSRRRVTISTSGVIPAMEALKKEMPVALAVSLHAPNDTLRDVLVPINKKYPLAELMKACCSYIEAAPRDFVTFEYVMLDGVNDQIEHAAQLVKLIRDVPCKLNLIPFNPFPNSGYQTSSAQAVRLFREYLQQAGYVVTVRKTRGEDIDAACGQLVGNVQDRTRRQVKYQETISIKPNF